MNVFDFEADEIDLAPYLPKNTEVKVRISALDYGSCGYIDDLYIIVVSNTTAIRVFYSVTSQPSETFNENIYSDLKIETVKWDQTPYYMTGPFTEKITIFPGSHCFLSGDELGKSGWKVDNFLLLELEIKDTIKRYVIGAVHSIYYKDEPLEQIGPSGFTFSPDDIDLAEYLPENEEVTLTISALDYGGQGYLSDLFLIFR